MRKKPKMCKNPNVHTMYCYFHIRIKYKEECDKCTHNPTNKGDMENE